MPLLWENRARKNNSVWRVESIFRVLIENPSISRREMAETLNITEKRLEQL